MGKNRNAIAKSFYGFRSQVSSEVRKHLYVLCDNILAKAFSARESAPGSHDFTGNLVNSIVVVLYDDGEIAHVLRMGEEGMVRHPISRKMSARKKPYFFSQDWSGAQSRYTADVKTNRGFASDDIEHFLFTHRPAYTDGYCVTVAYTVEYADWVESQRRTTGFLESRAYAGKLMRISFVPLKS
jgi:hypothetical protein